MEQFEIRRLLEQKDLIIGKIAIKMIKLDDELEIMSTDLRRQRSETLRLRQENAGLTNRLEVEGELLECARTRIKELENEDKEAEA